MVDLVVFVNVDQFLDLHDFLHNSLHWHLNLNLDKSFFLTCFLRFRLLNLDLFFRKF